MAYSDTRICNIALALVGADSIRSLDENNKRARICQQAYDYMRDFIMEEYDWDFARVYTKLNEITFEDETPTVHIPSGFKAYELPNDCMTPRDIAPEGTRDDWYTMGRYLYTKLSGDIYLWYTKKNIVIEHYSMGFIQLLSLGIAARVAYPITQDKALAKTLRDEFAIMRRDAIADNANIGSSYRSRDEDPKYDTFVTGGEDAYDDDQSPESRFLVTE